MKLAILLSEGKGIKRGENTDGDYSIHFMPCFKDTLVKSMCYTTNKVCQVLCKFLVAKIEQISIQHISCSEVCQIVTIIEINGRRQW